MKTIQLWEGTRGAECATTQFVGEELGEYESAYDSLGYRGMTYRVFRAETGNVIVHQYDWSRIAGEDHHAVIETFRSLDEAAECGFWSVLLKMRLSGKKAREVENWRNDWRRRHRKS